MFSRKSTRDSAGEADMADPFDDPSLVTTAFLDVLWQDEHGNSALMLAAAENRLLHLKGILHVAIESGKLWQVLEMRNGNGKTALEMAVEAGSETCAMVITEAAKKNPRERPRIRAIGSIPSTSLKEEEIQCKFVNEEPLARTPSEVSRISTILSKHRKMSREKMSNNLRRMHSSEYLKLMKRSRSAHGRFNDLRHFSSEGETSLATTSATAADVSEGGSAQNSAPPTPVEVVVRHTVGERLRAMFTHKKPPVDIANTCPDLAMRLAYPGKHNQDILQLSQNAVEETEDSTEDSFRSSPFSSEQTSKLPPLISLRRRTTSEGRRKQFEIQD